MNYEICQVPTYGVNYQNSKKTIKPIETIIAMLHSNISAHERLYKTDIIKLFVDVDKLYVYNPTCNIETIINNICDYVGVNIDEISYTCDDKKVEGSWHIVIPKYYMKSSLQKKFWETFCKKYNYGKEIDTGILDKETWFRLPNQTVNEYNDKQKNKIIKGKPTSHNIIQGEMKDFILKYVEEATEYMIEEQDGTDEEINSIISDITNPEKVIQKTIQKIISPEDNLKWVQEITYYIENDAFTNYVSEGNHLEYIKFGGMLLSAFSNDTAFKLWEMTTLKNGSANKKQEYKEQFKSLKPLENDPKKAFNTLKKWVKKYDAELIKLYKEQQNSPLENSYDKETEYKEWIVEEAIIKNTDVGFAKAFIAHYGIYFKATGSNQKTDAIWYYDNNKKLWNKDAGLANIRLTISNDFYKLFEEKRNEECNEKRSKILDAILIKLEKTNDKNNITREIMDFIIDTEFDKKLNMKKYVLPIKGNKMINMNTLEITERNMENYFSFECNAEYVEMTHDEETDIKKYLLDLFCGKEDTMKCMIDIIKSSLSGKVLRYIFFHTGSGRNGKSLFFKLLNNIFNRFMDIISKDVILQKKSNSHLNTEFEKLQTCRLAYITELNESDKLNNTNIKAISGGDPINLRTLQKTDATIIPTATNHILTNELPSFKEDNALRDRIIVCPYNNVFEVNNNFETEMLEKTNLLFSYIMKYGVIRDKFELTEEMKIATNEYNEDNSVDNLKEFIDLRCNKVEGKRILRNDFIKSYNDWLLENDKPKDNKTPTKFTKEMKRKYGIDNKESNSKLYYLDLEWKIINEDEN